MAKQPEADRVQLGIPHRCVDSDGSTKGEVTELAPGTGPVADTLVQVIGSAR